MFLRTFLKKKKPQQLNAAGSPISIREFLLLVGIVAAGIAWFKEYDQAQKLNEQLESIKLRFTGMLELEDKLRQDPTQKSAHYAVTEMGGPKPHLRWSMECTVIDDSPPPTSQPADAAASPSPPAAAPQDAPKATLKVAPGGTK